MAAHGHHIARPKFIAAALSVITALALSLAGATPVSAASPTSAIPSSAPSLANPSPTSEQPIATVHPLTKLTVTSTTTSSRQPERLAPRNDGRQPPAPRKATVSRPAPIKPLVIVKRAPLAQKLAPVTVAPKPLFQLAIEAAIPNTGRVQGNVTDSVTGGPFAGACIYLYNTDGSYAGTVNCAGGAGSYVLAGVTPGTYTAAVYDQSGTHPTTWYGNTTTQANATTFTVASGADTTGVNFSVTELTGVTGQVTDAVTTSRVEQACVYATQTSGGTNTYATCVNPADGHYAIVGMAAGGYDIAFYDAAGLRVTTHQTTTVTAGHVTFTADGVMPEVTGLVGTVLDSVSFVPIPNSCAMLYTPAGSYVSGSYRCTDASGRFIIDNVPAGTYKLAFYDPYGRFGTQWYDGKRDEGSASAVTITASTLTTAGAARVTTLGSATGVVLNADSTPAAGTCVYADDLAGHYSGSGSCSDQAGRYTLTGLASGQYRIAFYPSGSTGATPYWYLQHGTESTATPISIMGLQTTTLTDETLTTTPPPTAPGPVTTLTATSTNNTVHLTWVNPGEASFSGATVRRAVGTTAPAIPTDGTAVADVRAPGNTLDDTHVIGGQTYSYAVFAHDTVPNYAAAVTTNVTASAASGVQHECGHISVNTTWSPAAAPSYQLDCAVIIDPDTTLTLAPGTIVKGSNSSSGFTVSGSLIASGTAASPVVLTSWRDDTVGGDTNGDGSLSGPAAGDWGGISASSVGGTSATNLSLHQVQLGWAGTGVSVYQASVSVTNSVFSHFSADGIDVSQSVGVPTWSCSPSTAGSFWGSPEPTGACSPAWTRPTSSASPTTATRLRSGPASTARTPTTSSRRRPGSSARPAPARSDRRTSGCASVRCPPVSVRLPPAARPPFPSAGRPPASPSMREPTSGRWPRTAGRCRWSAAAGSPRRT